jgi:hypothetical protein
MANDEFDNARTDKAMLARLKMPAMTQEQAEARYRDYSRGWTDGSRGTTLLRLGTSEPEYMDEYERGTEDGRRARNEALSARFNALFR